MVFQLNESIAFPDPHLGEPDGLLAIGGDLSPERLRLAYHFGIFPWFSFKRGLIKWWCPMERFVIFTSEIHISHSMRSILNSGRYSITVNRSFDQVLRHCSEVNGRNQLEGAWLGEEMIAAYTRLHEQNLCASVEVWDGDPDDGKLVGGLYGVPMGRAFIGESMFSLIPSGSKIALIGLAQLLRRYNCTLIDCQFETPHLKSMGGRYIPYDDYLKVLGTIKREQNQAEQK